MTTSDDVQAVGPQASAWLAGLGDVMMVRHRDGEVVDSRRLGVANVDSDCSTQVDALEAIQEGSTYLFWFTDKSKNGGPVLLLEESMGALKAQAQELASDAPSFRGQVLNAEWGLEFRLQKPSPDLLKGIASWVSIHHEAWPALLGIVNARATVRNKNGDIVERYKDSASWAPLRAKES